MSLTHNEETRKAALSVSDRAERKQREIWGTSALPSVPTASDLYRHYSGIPTQSHSRRFRRSYRNPAISWSRVSSNYRAFGCIRPARIPRPAVRLPKSWLFASHRARGPSRNEGKHTATDAYTVRRGGQRDCESICSKDQDMESTGAL